MTAPPGIRRKPAPEDRLTSTRPSDKRDSTNAANEFDFDDRVVAQVDWSIWKSLREGHFRLAVPCRICGRWLTDPRSKRAHVGPRCAEAVAE